MDRRTDGLGAGRRQDSREARCLLVYRALMAAEERIDPQAFYVNGALKVV